MGSCNFTHAHYLDTLREYVKSDFKVSGFSEYLATPHKKHIILRHDIDLDMNAANVMAEKDQAAGVTSTFFFRLHSTRYNLSSLENLRILKRMREMGHELAFHFEPGLARVLGSDTEPFAQRQKAIIENILGEPIHGLSTHEPARADEPELVEKLVQSWGLKYHAYETRFTKDMKYISDSSARWREGCFCQWIGKADQMQILTHPFWWYNQASQENY